MTCCSHCRDAEGFFGSGTARREMKRYRRKGPSKPTRLLLEAIRGEGVEGNTLLDVGGGIGAIQHELLDEGLRAATQVDASHAYLEVSRKEAEGRGHADRTTYVYGDFVELAPKLPDADVVTLDRVICCYPDLEALLEASVSRARRVLGLVYPRERWGARMAMAIGNLWFRIRGSAFRVYLHSPARVDALLRGAGFQPARTSRTFIWRVETYVRRRPESLEGPREDRWRSTPRPD